MLKISEDKSYYYILSLRNEEIIVDIQTCKINENGKYFAHFKDKQKFPLVYVLNNEDVKLVEKYNIEWIY